MHKTKFKAGKKCRKYIPDKENRIPCNKSFGTNKHAPACSKKMPFWLS